MLLSIIIPCFNTEKYLKECLDSILVNKSKNYEVILINDGSKDNTLNACKEYESKYQNIKVINQINSGVSIARNNGIKNSTGKYIMFVDSDDILDINWSKLINDKFLNDSNEDIVYFSNKLNNNINREEIIKLICGYNENKICIGGPYSKLFKKELLVSNNILFDNNLINGEDMIFNLNAISSTKNIKSISKSFYKYRLYQGSSTKKFDERIIKNDIYFNENIDNILNKCIINSVLRNQIENFFIGNGMLGIFSKISYLPNKKINKDLFNFLENDTYKNYLNIGKFNLFSKYKIFLLNLIKKRKYKSVILLYKIKRNFHKENTSEIYKLI